MAFTAGSDTGLPCYIGCAVINTVSNFSPNRFYTRETLPLAQETATGNLGQSLPLVVKALKLKCFEGPSLPGAYLKTLKGYLNHKVSFS